MEEYTMKFCFVVVSGALMVMIGCEKQTFDNLPENGADMSPEWGMSPDLKSPDHKMDDLQPPREVFTKLGDPCVVYVPFNLPVVDEMGNKVPVPICAISPGANFYPLFQRMTVGVISRPPSALIFYLYYPSSSGSETRLFVKRFGSVTEETPTLMEPDRLYRYDTSVVEYVRSSTPVLLKFIPLFQEGHYFTHSYGHGWRCDINATDDKGNDIPNSCVF